MPLADQLGALAELQDAGKIRHIGLSEVTVGRTRGGPRRSPRSSSVQNMYNLAERKSEDVLEYAEANGIGFIPWFPMATGQLARPAGRSTTAARSTGATPVAARAGLAARALPVMLPIPGTTSVAHLEENIGAARTKLSDDVYQTLAQAV